MTNNNGPTMTTTTTTRTPITVIPTTTITRTIMTAKMMMTKMMKVRTTMTTKKTTTNGQRCNCDAALPFKFKALRLLWTPSSPLHIQVSELAVDLFLSLSNSSL
jgi:hypothetical protein